LHDETRFVDHIYRIYRHVKVQYKIIDWDSNIDDNNINNAGNAKPLQAISLHRTETRTNLDTARLVITKLLLQKDSTFMHHIMTSLISKKTP